MRAVGILIMKTTKETRAQRRKRRADAVRRATYHLPDSAKIADRARDWSDERIRKTYGVDPTKRFGYAKKPSKATIRKAKRQLEMFMFYRAEGEPVEVAISKKKAKRPQRFIIGGGASISNKQQWKIWSKNKSFPKRIIEGAEAINKQYANDPNYSKAGFEEESGYGYVIMYWSYILGRTPEEIMEEYAPDRFDADRYMELALTQ